MSHFIDGRDNSAHIIDAHTREYNLYNHLNPNDSLTGLS